MKYSYIFLTLLVLGAATLVVRGDSHTKPYADGDNVVVWANKVGPFRNPQETYLYYSLPFCEPDEVVETHAEGLGEALQGYELRKTPLEAHFKVDSKSTTLCTKSLTKDEAERFRYAVENQYWYQLFIDDLPVWGMVGEVLVGDDGDEHHYLYTHKKFTVTYNGDRVIEVNLTSETLVEIKAREDITFTYAFQWYPTNTPYELRFDRYLDDNFFEHQIHWFSIFNSFMMVVFLVGLVSMILLRTLRKDYARYAREDDLEDDERGMDDSGWKQVSGDVFRPPGNLVIFSALIGTGYQLAILAFLVIFFAILGTYYVKRGTLVTCFVFSYALTSFIAGYAGGGFYARNGGQLWIKNMLIIAGLFPGTIAVAVLALDLVAVMYGSLASIPIGTMFIMLIIWAFVSFPLTVGGTIIGKNYDGKPDHPCRINPVPRPIPTREWYLQPWVNIVLGGILPFGSIFIEMYFVFTSFWHYKFYYVYGFLLLVYIILIIVTVCTSIVSTYFLLNAEDWRWQWTSFLGAASTGVYVFIYAAYFYVSKTSMSGFFQTSFYFGYCAMMAFGLSLLCGSIGYFGTSVFVSRIYRGLKLD